MSDLTFIQTESRIAAVIPISCSFSEMPLVFGPAVQEIVALVQEQGLKMTSACFAHHLEMPNDGRFNFEVGFCVDKEVKEQGRVKPGVYPGHEKVAFGKHVGKYENLHNSWEKFMGEIEEKIKGGDFKIGTTLVEVYEIGPHSGVSEDEYVTELYRPLTRATGTL